MSRFVPMIVHPIIIPPIYNYGSNVGTESAVASEIPAFLMVVLAVLVATACITVLLAFIDFVRNM